MSSLFDSIFVTGTFDVEGFLICICSALILGLIISLGYMVESKYTKSFVITLATLPAVIAIVIMLVNGNVGTGVAVAGAFSLVRFRSVPGTAREIGALFLAMCTGLALGTGYVAIASLFVVILTAWNIVLFKLNFGETKDVKKMLTITIPEDLDYHNVFEDVFAAYTKNTNLVHVKTTAMGSLFKLKYETILLDSSKEKELIDCLRCRNGNLEISISLNYALHQEL